MLSDDARSTKFGVKKIRTARGWRVLMPTLTSVGIGTVLIKKRYSPFLPAFAPGGHFAKAI